MKCKGGRGGVRLGESFASKAPTASFCLFGFKLQLFEMLFEVGLFASIRKLGALRVNARQAFSNQGFGKFFPGVFKKDEGVVATTLENGLPAGDDSKRSAGQQVLRVFFGHLPDGDRFFSCEVAKVTSLVVESLAVVLMKAFFWSIDKVEPELPDLPLMRHFETVAVVVAVRMEAATGEGLEAPGGFWLRLC